MSEPRNTENLQVWGPWPTVGFGLAIAIVALASQMLVALIFAILKVVADPALDPLQLVEELATNGLVTSLAIYASAIVGVGLIVVFIKVRKTATIAEYLGLLPVTKKTIFVSLAIVIGFIIMSFVLSTILGKTSDSEYMIDAYRTTVWPALFWVAVVIFGPVFEESFFRGFLFAGLQQSRIGATGAILLTSLFWSLSHIQYGVYELVSIFALGIVLGIMRLKTGSLLAPLITHSFFNLIVMLMLELTVRVNGTLN